MIFCTVGNDHRRFLRFEEVVRKLAQSHHIVFQYGYSNPVSHKNVINVDFLSSADFEEHLKSAEEVYSHGGAGTLLICAQLGKFPKVLSREKKYGEHINDHQKEIVSAFFELGLLDQIDAQSVMISPGLNQKKCIRTTTRKSFITAMSGKIKKYLK